MNIPAAALEAACRAYTEIMLDVAPESAIEAAIAAALSAWPGVRISWLASNDGAIVLPLPTEASDGR